MPAIARLPWRWLISPVSLVKVLGWYKIDQLRLIVSVVPNLLFTPLDVI